MRAFDLTITRVYRSFYIIIIVLFLIYIIRNKTIMVNKYMLYPQSAFTLCLAHVPKLVLQALGRAFRGVKYTFFE